MNDIFLSYAHGDLERVTRIISACEARGWSVFWDRTIPAGKTWREIIGGALDGARCVVVAWSRTSIKSDWVQEEADEGRKRGILIPILLDDVSPPLGFRGLQAASLVDPTTAALRPVLASIAALLDTSSPAAHEATQDTRDVPKAPTEQSRNRASLGRTVGVPLLVTVAGFAVGGALGLAITFSIVGLFGPAFGGGVGWSTAGILSGYTIGKCLRLLDPAVRGEQILMFTVGWAIAGGIGGLLSWQLLTMAGGIAAGGLAGAIGGAVTGLGLRVARPSFRWLDMGVLVFGWAVAGSLGSALSWAFLGFHYTLAFYAVVGAATGSTIGLLGGLLMFSYLSLTSKEQGE
jgi:hypothetical protein